MAFTGKATYDAGSTLPELAEDVSELVGIISPFDTPLLDAIGNAPYPAKSTHHEWMEDKLLPNTDTIASGSYDVNSTNITVSNPSYFRIGDLIQVESDEEVMQVTAVNAQDIDVSRGYGATNAGTALAATKTLIIIGHAALEGEEASGSVFENRARLSNYTQIFTESVLISGTQNAVKLQGIDAEFDYQLQNRLRELLRSLEQTVISGYKAASNPHGSDTVRRTMGGILEYISGSNAVIADAAAAALTEATLNAQLKTIWERGGSPNAIVVNGFQKRKISGFAGTRYYEPEDKAFRTVSVYYESDFGLQRVILSRWVPQDKVLLLDLNKIRVLPLQNRSFHVKQLSEAGDYHKAQVIGEYTLEVFNAGDGGHGYIKNCATS